MLIYAFRDMGIHIYGLKASSEVIGYSIGIWLSFLYLKKKVFKKNPESVRRVFIDEYVRWLYHIEICESL
jgi:hypothetical protein